MEIVRIDSNLTAAVNRALAAAMLVNVRAGVRSMIKEGVPAKIAARVLFNPQQRRATDWQH
jgi:hypothetical protein